MPAASSMIRTVPDGNVAPVGAGAGADAPPGPATASSSVPLPATTRPITTTSTRASTPRPTIQPVRPPLPGGAAGGTAGEDVRGWWAAGCWTATPGPAGVATSDQLTPFHQRTRPGVPS